MIPQSLLLSRSSLSLRHLTARAFLGRSPARFSDCLLFCVCALLLLVALGGWTLPAAVLAGEAEHFDFGVEFDDWFGKMVLARYGWIGWEGGGDREVGRGIYRGLGGAVHVPMTRTMLPMLESLYSLFMKYFVCQTLYELSLTKDSLSRTFIEDNGAILLRTDLIFHCSRTYNRCEIGFRLEHFANLKQAALSRHF